MKWGYISAKKLETERSIIFLCPFHQKPRQSGVSLESLELENISQVPRNRDEVGQNHDARKAVSATSFSLKVKWGYILSQKLESERSNSSKRPPGVSLESPGLENIPPAPENRAKVGQNPDVRKAVLAIL